MAEKLSKKLNETLSEKDRKTIEGLFEFDENLKNLYNEAICNDAQRESIANKELNITYLIEQIVKIKNKHISNEEKKNQLHELLKDVDIDYILDEVENEIKKVQKCMIDRAKEMSNELQKKYGIIQRSFSSYIETEQEKGKAAEDRRKEILNSEKKKAKEQKTENQLIEYKKGGFWNNLREILSGKHEKEGKKLGIFSSIKQAWAKAREKNTNKNIADKSNDEVEITDWDVDLAAVSNEEVEKLEAEYRLVTEQVKASKENVKKLEEQQRQLKEQVIQASERVMEKAKDRVLEVTEPIPEEKITEERVKGIREYISEYRQERGQVKIDKLDVKIDNIEQEIEELKDDLEFRKSMKGTNSINDKQNDKDIEYDQKVIQKKQDKAEKLAQKRNNLYRKYSRDDSGMDR